jgi:hypothetical protein
VGNGCYERLPSRWMVGTNDLGHCGQPGHVFDPASNWHTYRVEVKGNIVRLRIDGFTMASVNDNHSLAPGHVGLWSNNYQLEVRSFKVIKLETMENP